MTKNYLNNKKVSYYFFVLFFLFFLSRIINLTLLPIFNDEAIYLDWGQRMINAPGFAFYSLYDGKQPFLMWIFGIANKLISDPLMAGRLVSVALGGLGLLGIYLLSGFFLPSPFRLIVPIIYTIVPIFVFFDRQALMESGVTSVNIWSFYFLTRFLKKKNYFSILMLGIIFGFGLFIKSSSGIFLLLATIILLYAAFEEKHIKDKQKLFLALFVVLFLSFLISLPLILQPDFGNIIKGTSRFNLTFTELISFPLTKWSSNFLSFFKISLWHLTPPLFLLMILGLIRAIREKRWLLLFWFSAGLTISVFTARNLNPRYVVSLLPVASIFIALGLTFLFNPPSRNPLDVVPGIDRKFSLRRTCAPTKTFGDFISVSLWSFRKQKILGYISLVSLVFPFYVTLLLIFKPLDYFDLLNKSTAGFSQKWEYVTGNPAGYGLDKVRNFLEEKARQQPIFVGVRLDAGNPENALIAYYFKNPRIAVVYFDKQLIRPEVSIEKISFSRPMYFVSRSEHRGGLEGYLVEEFRAYKPEGKSYFGVYRFVTK